MGFSRQEYWNGLPCPPPGNLPDPGIKPYVSCIGRQILKHLPRMTEKTRTRRGWIRKKKLGNCSWQRLQALSEEEWLAGGGRQQPCVQRTVCTENRMCREPRVQKGKWVQSQGNWLRCPRVPAGPMSCDTDTFPPRMTGRYGRVWITGQERHRRGRRVKREVYPYGRFMLRRGRNQHNIVKQLSPN